MHIQNEKKKFVCARIRVVINKTFLLFSQHPKRVITPLKKKAMKRNKIIVYSFLTHFTKLDRYLNPSCNPKTVKACTKRKFALRSYMHKQLRLLVNP